VKEKSGGLWYKKGDFFVAERDNIRSVQRLIFQEAEKEKGGAPKRGKERKKGLEEGGVFLYIVPRIISNLVETDTKKKGTSRD